MTKSQLISALIKQGDVTHVITQLLEKYERLDPDGYYEDDLVEEALDILKELEDGDQPVYFRETTEEGYDCAIGNIVYERPQVLWTHREPKEGRPISLILTA